MGGTELAVRPSSGQTGENGHTGENGYTGENQIGGNGSGQIGENVGPRFPCARLSCLTLASKKCSRCRAVYYCSRQALQKKYCVMATVISVVLSISSSSVLTITMLVIMLMNIKNPTPKNALFLPPSVGP